jgi:hypothetical protein
MKELGTIGKDFPSVQTAAIIDEPETDRALYRCSKNLAAPKMPTKLPFIPVQENMDKIKEWLLGKYAASTVNKWTWT